MNKHSKRKKEKKQVQETSVGNRKVRGAKELRVRVNVDLGPR